MSPEHPSPYDPPFPTEPRAPETFPVWTTPVRPRKFQSRWVTHALLFVGAFITTTWAGTLQTPEAQSLYSWHWSGMWYSVPLLLILGAHEFGHYGYCRRHDVDATLPYFLPAPLPLTGTLGAVIRIREAFPNKRALFDIGVAGPIAGFLVLVPVLYIGVGMSSVIQPPSGSPYFGEPLLYKLMEWIHFGHLPAGYDTALHPLGFAAWWGMLATALNLMPFGQLDGGHIAYSLFGRRASYVSLATVSAAVVLTVISISWLSVTIMMLVMAFFLGIGHPRMLDEDEPLDGRRKFVAFLALVIFVICFTPVPIETFIG